MRITRGILLAVVTVSLVTAGCGGSDSEDDDTGIPNPAAVFCEEQGGITSGPEPMCELPDGSIVDAWEFYREQNPTN